VCIVSWLCSQNNVSHLNRCGALYRTDSERPCCECKRAMTSSSHGGHAIDLHVAHRIGAVSADDFLAHSGRLRRQSVDTTVKTRASSASTGAAGDGTEGATGGQYSCRPQSEVEGRQLQQEGAVLRRLVVAGGAMRHPVAPQRRVDARVELRTPVHTVLHDVAGRWQHRPSADREPRVDVTIRNQKRTHAQAWLPKKLNSGIRLK
jgi:hypothetical protein